MTHTVDDNSKTLVQVCAGLGMTQVNIGKLMGISDSTLRNYYGEELEKAKAAVDQLVFSALMKNISAGKESSIIFYLKARCGWKETQEIKVEGLPPVVLNINFGTHIETIQSQPAPLTIDHVPNEGS